MAFIGEVLFVTYVMFLRPLSGDLNKSVLFRKVFLYVLFDFELGGAEEHIVWSPSYQTSLA